MTGAALAAVAVAAAAGASLPSGGQARLERLHASPGTTARRPADRRPMAAGPATVAVLALSIGFLATGSVAPGLVVGAAAALGSRWWSRRRRRQAAADRRGDLVELCLALASELRSGAPPREALAAAVDGLPAFSELGVAARSPVSDVAAAMTGAAAVPGGAGLAYVAACWRVAERNGIGLAPSVARLAEGLRDDEQVRREVAAQLAGPRATAVLLALLPGLGLMTGSSLGGDPVGLLTGTPVGLALCIAGGALEWAGVAWMTRITRRAELP